MAIDIVTGDFLVIGSNEYPIKKSNVWLFDDASDASFADMATVSCSTKRSSTENNDMFITGIATNLSGLSCLPLDPVSADMARAQGLESAYELKYTMIADSTSYAQVFVEDVKRT